MKLNYFLSVMAVGILSLQANAQKITTDFDKNADFTQYKSITFLGWQQGSEKLINDLDKERMRTAFVSEFKSRAMEKGGEDADLAITLYLVLEQKTSTTAYTNYYGGAGSYGRYGRGGWGWGNGYTNTTYSENDYIKGTLVMDVYDNSSNQLIWQGVASGTVKENPKK
ncbi:MAG: DUF4136 domain-containing protein, partial [Cyclobacteriaceae bacterium]|nr:DUF4136 domain-containing protein [Cyclobacteriaceae bacterium]